MMDPMKALRSAVLASADITGIMDESVSTYTTEQRVVVNRIPDGQIAAADTFHPPKMLVLRMAGGSPKSDTTRLDAMFVNALCYGESDFQADRLRRAVWERFIYLSRECHDGVLIHSINSTGGPIVLTDPDIVWPAVVQGFSILADVEDAA